MASESQIFLQGVSGSASVGEKGFFTPVHAGRILFARLRAQTVGTGATGFEVRINGVSVFSSTPSLSSGSAASSRVAADGTAEFDAGDKISLHIASTANVPPQNISFELELDFDGVADAVGSLIGLGGREYVPANSQHFGVNSSLDAWDYYDADAAFTAVAEDGRLVLTKDNESGTQYRGVARPLPAGNFTAITRVTIQPSQSGNGGQKVFFAVFEDVADASKAAAGVGAYIDNNSGPYIAITSDKIDDSTTNGSIGSTNNQSLGVGVRSLFLKIVKTSTNYKFYASTDGEAWFKSYDGTLSFTPADVGFYLDTAGTEDIVASVAWLRIYQ